jgi:hypothetical protein
MAKKRPVGRPTKPKREKYKTPQRQLGRVDEERWQSYKDAAQAEGKTFTQWACGELDKAVKRWKRNQ